MLQKLILENFRNHRKLEICLGNVTVLLGENGAGKSNILEAIFLLSSCRSFREDDKKNLINIDAKFGRVVGDDLEVFIQKEPIAMMKAKEKGVFKRQSDFVGRLKSVVFSPETMLLATGSPRLRRKFLDLMISQKKRPYLSALIAYEKIRTQRNSLLQRIREQNARPAELDFWDAELRREGRAITEMRKDAINFLNKKIIELYKGISGNSDDLLEIDYVKNDRLDNLTDYREKEIWQGRTLCGPHLDDIVLYLNHQPLANFASRGEIRSAILALKIGELNFLKNDDGDLPILLLDDVFSEFDHSRRSHLDKLIGNYQTIITTTDKLYLADWLNTNPKFIEVN